MSVCVRASPEFTGNMSRLRVRRRRLKGEGKGGEQFSFFRQVEQSESKEGRSSGGEQRQTRPLLLSAASECLECQPPPPLLQIFHRLLKKKKKKKQPPRTSSIAKMGIAHA